ncbi:MAG: ABC transporter permease [Bacteroidetes bacterium]|nr:ABC transporter permease [Bacteroidota bacterium]
MFKNYFKIAFRNLWRHRVFSLINILGLTVGMTACFLIFLYVRFELSYDDFNTKADRIYRIVADIKTPTETLHARGPAWAVTHNLASEFPEVTDYVRLYSTNLLTRKGDVKYQESSAIYADSAFFRIFDIPLLKGDPGTALKEPWSVVMSETTAKKYFGDANPVGQMILLTGDAKPARVTGLMKDVPENAHFKADMIVSMSTVTGALDPELDNQWDNYGLSAYLLLKPGTDAAALQKKFPAFLEKKTGDQMKKSQMYATLMLEPLRDVYLRSTRNGDRTGNINNIYIFSIVAIFILIIACINFINLTTARSAERAREVGIRKVVGAGRGQLTRQFIGESLVICMIAFLLTLLASWLLLPGFNHLAGKTVSTGIFSNINYLLILLLAAIAVGVLAGLYPAFVLSAYKPTSVLKGRFATSGKGTFLRKSLVVTQFTISIALIIGTIIVYNQMSYMRNQSLGFNKDQLLVINTYGDHARNAFRDAVLTIPTVKSVALSSSVPGGGNMGAYSELENKNGDMQIANIDLYFVDWDYIPQFQIKMVAGRSFDRAFGTDTTQAMVLNETAVKMLGYSSPQQAVGRRFRQWGREGKVIGVMKDFHYRSLAQEIKPLSMRIDSGGTNLASIKMSAANITSTIAAIENKWKTLIPGRPFSYTFLDESFDKQYRGEQRFGNLFLNFAILAILISCLGLLGLASYSTMQRTREIGVRKVMGATVPNIVSLLSGDFLKLVLLAFVLASPIAWFFMYRWLNDFAYRTHISWWIFALAGITAALIAIATISVQAVRAAMANPVKSLRTE